MKKFKREKEGMEIMNISNKEEEILNSYGEKEKTDENSKQRKINKIINVIFTIIILILMLVTADIVCVAKYNIGPFFAIPVHTYKDGGTKEYYGLGYKVIKYNQIQGRRDKVIGTWSLKYNAEPVTVQDIDLAIEITEDQTQAYEKYYKKFVRIISTLNKIDEENHTITIGYVDEDGKYSLDIVCQIVEEEDISDLELEKEITIIGTVNNFKEKTSKKANRLYLENCFAEQ